MSSSAALDADASRQRSGILMPVSDGSLNRQNQRADGPPSKHASVTALDRMLRPSIAIRPHPTNLQVKPRVLLPLMLLPRMHLPLSSLDMCPPDAGFPQTRLVESQIKILDLEARLGSAPTVVIAKSESRGTVYALERHDHGLYVMCKIGAWVDLEQLSTKATAVSHERFASRPPDRCSRPLTTVHHSTKQQKHKRAAIEAFQCHIRKRTKALSPTSPGCGEDVSSEEPSLRSEPQQLPSPDLNCDGPAVISIESGPIPPPSAGTSLLDTPNGSLQTAENIFEGIRSQYFEMLYRSLGSLAYFAKGPLSRARSDFQLDLESNLDITDLIDFLKSLTLTTVQIDKKYRETVPEVIGQMNITIDASDEDTQKRRKPKKIKLGKDALYPLEDKSIRKWWRANKPEPAGEDMGISASQTKSIVSRLRTRETQLQMIVILEILALESLDKAESRENSDLPTLPGTESESTRPAVATQPKKRNKKNLPVLLDVHADRLTIWQSITVDELDLEVNSQVRKDSQDSRPLQRPSSEPLRDFCVDVIVPFFSARLPELCDAVSRKLGGPIIISLAAKSGRRSSSKRDQKSGVATKRATPLDAKRTLQRALSTERMHRRSVSRGPGNAIALMRSATSASLLGIKREGSELVSLADLPSGNSLMGRQRQPLSRSASASQAGDTKASKRALVEAELRDAISALRKPNRQVVSKAMAEADERRATAGLSANKARRIPKGGLAPFVQVKATPVNNRFRDVLALEAESSTKSAPDGGEDMVPPSSIDQLVPSTGHRHGHRDALADSALSSSASLVQTPRRGASQPAFLRRAATELPAMLPSTPSSRTHTAHTTLRDRAAAHAEGWLKGTEASETMITPVRRKASASDLFKSPVPTREAGRTNTLSIYEKLGWDDDLNDF